MLKFAFKLVRSMVVLGLIAAVVAKFVRPWLKRQSQDGESGPSQ